LAAQNSWAETDATSINTAPCALARAGSRSDWHVCSDNNLLALVYVDDEEHRRTLLVQRVLESFFDVRLLGEPTLQFLAAGTLRDLGKKGHARSIDHFAEQTQLGADIHLRWNGAMQADEKQAQLVTSEPPTCLHQCSLYKSSMRIALACS
jgi:hypothetical protein